MQTFEDLIRIVAELRSGHGCPWDRRQTFESLKTCLTDEADEVIQAVEQNDMENLCEELGDVLLQVVMYSQIAQEQGLFTLEDVTDGICRKMVRRHPHVFGDAKALTPEASLELWNEIKRQEKADRQEKAKKP